MSLLVFLFTDLVIEPFQETGITPVKMYTRKYAPIEDELNWNIIAVSENLRSATVFVQDNNGLSLIVL